MLKSNCFFGGAGVRQRLKSKEKEVASERDIWKMWRKDTTGLAVQRERLTKSNCIDRSIAQILKPIMS